jgi:hypothetical protein
MGNTFGHLFRITTWGESHGGGVGVVIDGCPPRLELSEADIQPDLDRRRPGQSKIVTPRKETDTVRILSGTFEGRTLGTPISLWVKNEDQRSEAYSEMATKFRPSHADYTYQAKYGIRAWPGGGRTSARETIGRVAAGAIAKKILRERFGVEVLACVTQVQDIAASVDPETFSSRRHRGEHRSLPRCRRGRAHDHPDRTAPNRGRQRGWDRSGRRPQRPHRLGGSRLRPSRGRPGQSHAQPPRVQGLRHRKRVCRNPTHGSPAQRRLPEHRRPGAHPLQPVRRHPGRNQQRRNRLLPGRLQTRRHRHARAGNGGCRGPRHHPQRPGPP